MDYNLVTYSEFCQTIMRSILESNVILYYSHIPTAIVSLLLGLFIFIKNRKDGSSRLFFLVTVLFGLWSFFDLILWSSPDSRKTMFFWSIINLLENMVSCFTLYFVYVFLEKKDVLLRYKAGFALLFLPYLALLPTHYNITGFNATLCEAQQGSLINYFYFLEGVFLATLLGYTIWKICKTSGTERRQVAYLAVGSMLFLLSFSGANIAGSIASVINPDDPNNWKILQYGLFGMPVFLAFLTFLIVKYQAFNLKLLGAQALVLGLISLIGSQLFFIREMTSYILVAITFVLAALFGIILIRSVKEEVRRKEELQELTQELAEANQELKRLDAAKSEFISIASHQLRTPLTAIRGYISLVLEGSYGKVTPTLQDVLNKVYVVNNRMGQLVEDLLSISRIESGRVQYNLVATQLEPMVADLVDMFSIMAKSKGLALKMKLPKKSLPKLMIDATKMREVISNLIDNALKYTKEGGVTVTVDGDDRYVAVRVQDTGIGVDPQDSKRLFEKFTRSSETMKLDVSGTGLGLYVGKNFVEAHGGLLSVESEGPGKGSTFIIKLPVEPPRPKSVTS
jgi:signal transduction histidine kinase